MMRQPPRLTTALPLIREGDGPDLCRRFCRMFGAPSPGTRHGPARSPRIPHRLWLKDGPYLCVCHCRSFAEHKPIKIRRPRLRGMKAALGVLEETRQ